MRRGDRRLFFTALVAPLAVAFGGCVSHAPYPPNWPSAVAGGHAGCKALRGSFDNVGSWVVSGDRDERLLAALFFPLQSSEPLRHHAERRAVSHLTFDAAPGGDIDVRAWVGDAVLFERTLTSQEVGCKEERSVFSSKGWVLDGLVAAAARVSSRYSIALASDGSLVMEQREVGAGVIFLVVPMASKATTWLRFTPYDEATRPMNAPYGVRSAGVPSRRLLPPAEAPSGTAYGEAEDCIRVAKARSANPAGESSLERLGGRATADFLIGDRHGELVASGDSHDTFGWVPASHGLRVEKLHWEPPAVTDYYALCLLEKGFRWES